MLVDGIDSDHASIARAREHLAGSGVEDRVTFHERNAADAGLAGRYDLVTIFEALHARACGRSRANVRVLYGCGGRDDHNRATEPEASLKPVVAVPLWIAVPVYLTYAAVWIALFMLTFALTAVVMIGYRIVSFVRRRQS